MSRADHTSHLDECHEAALHAQAQARARMLKSNSAQDDDMTHTCADDAPVRSLPLPPRSKYAVPVPWLDMPVAPLVLCGPT